MRTRRADINRHRSPGGAAKRKSVNGWAFFPVSRPLHAQSGRRADAAIWPRTIHSRPMRGQAKTLGAGCCARVFPWARWVSAAGRSWRSVASSVSPAPSDMLGGPAPRNTVRGWPGDGTAICMILVDSRPAPDRLRLERGWRRPVSAGPSGFRRQRDPGLSGRAGVRPVVGDLTGAGFGQRGPRRRRGCGRRVPSLGARHWRRAAAARPLPSGRGVVLAGGTGRLGCASRAGSERRAGAR